MSFWQNFTIQVQFHKVIIEINKILKHYQNEFVSRWHNFIKI